MYFASTPSTKRLAEKILVPFDEIPKDPKELATLIEKTPLLHKLPVKYSNFKNDLLYYDEVDSQTSIADVVTTALLSCNNHTSISTICELLIQNPLTMFNNQVRDYAKASPKSERPKFDG